jgi:hypothetical protein
MYYGTPPIVTNGMVLNLDTQSPQSIPLDPTINLFNSSENIPVFPWTSNNGTRVTSSMAAPYGPGSASLYSATAGFSNVYQERTLYQGTYNLSWYIKYINQRYYTLLLEGNSAGRVTFDLLNGTTVAGTLAGSGTSPVIEPAPNGYYRISLSLNITTSSISLARPLLWTGLYNGNSNSGSQAYIWGAQLSRTSYVTPYISSSSTVLGARTSWQDISGNNNTATLFSSSISGSIPVFPAANNRVLNFDGSGSYAQSSRTITGSTYTVEVVFNADTVILGLEKWLVSQYPGTDRIIFDIFTDNTLRNWMGNGTNPSSAAIYSTTIIQPGRWYYATFTKDTLGTGSLYVNGIRESVGPLSTGTPPNSPVQIGGSTSFTNRWFDGKIGFTKIYNRALSQAEITQNYNALKSRFGLQ